jgi:REP-associated tyrosine transposase
MARPLRIEFPNAVYHVMTRGIDRQKICRDDADRNKWLSILCKIVQRFEWQLFAFCLLDNHFHLFFQTPDCSLSSGMHQLNGQYAGYFNRRHGRHGPLLQGRFKAIVVEDESYWLELSRYVHLNPVRAGLCERPEEWPWSSYRAYHRPDKSLKWLDCDYVLREFDKNLRRARKAYREFLSEGLGRKLDNPLDSALHGLVLGSEALLNRIKGLVSSLSEDPGRPQLGQLKRDADLAKLTAAIAKKLGCDTSEWRLGRKANDRTRMICAYALAETTGSRHSEIAEVLRYGHASSVGAACRLVRRQMKSPKFHRKIVALIEHARRYSLFEL